MEPNILITSGDTFSDIDTIACGVALHEIRNKNNQRTSLFLPGPQNQSITTSVRKWDYQVITAQPNTAGLFILVDISDPNYLKQSLDLSRVIELYDHHYGFEKFWSEKIGPKSHIEPVGACATLIWEEADRNKINLSKVSANLLYTAIFSNTLNFNATVTHQRDKDAFRMLSSQVQLPNRWIEIYFQELESESIKNPENSIINDIKTDIVANFDKPLFIGQLELWNSQSFLQTNQTLIKKTLSAKNSPYWFFTSPSISEGKNYLYVENDQVKNILTKLLGAKFVGDIGETSSLVLRKEILKKLHET